MYKGKGLKRNTQAGFTLIEIAVVLVIIGLLIGGILQGTALIDNSRVKKASSDFQSIAAAVISYQDRYQRYPGDDGNAAALQARGGNWTTLPNGSAGDNDGALEVTAAQTFQPGGENVDFWAQLRAGEFISGDHVATGVAALPRNAFGGLTGVTSATLGTWTGVKICMSQVPGKAAAALDLQNDDGIPGTGSMRGNVTTATTSAATQPTATYLAAYSEDNIYTICRKI